MIIDAQKVHNNLDEIRRTLIGEAIIKLRMHSALRRIAANRVHHPQCVLDNCRQACPIRIATEALGRMRL